MNYRTRAGVNGLNRLCVNGLHYSHMEFVWVPFHSPPKQLDRFGFVVGPSYAHGSDEL